MTLLTAVEALKPGISQVNAMASWALIKSFSDALSPFLKTSYYFAACSTGCIALSILASLTRARVPSYTSKNSNYSIAATSALWTMTALYGSAMTVINLSIGSQYSGKILQAIDHLKTSMSPSDTALADWMNLKNYVTKMPQFTASIQRSLLITSILAAGALIATAIALKSQERKNRLDFFAAQTLALASVASLCGYIYARTYCPTF